MGVQAMEAYPEWLAGKGKASGVGEAFAGWKQRGVEGKPKVQYRAA